MASTSKIEISYSSLANNVEFVKSQLNPGTILSAVIKGNAYGHGIKMILPALEKMSVNHFSVYSSSEAQKALKYKKRDTTILIMGFIYDYDYEWIIKNKIEFYIYELNVLNRAIEVAKYFNKKAIIHIDIETGMNRTGLSLSDLKKAIKLIQKNDKHLIIRGVTSHLAGSESIANHFRITKQLMYFKKRIRLLNQYGIEPEIRHIACSAATINYPTSQFEMVRTGILIYGYWPTRETFINFMHKKKIREDKLKRVMRWTSKVMSIKKVKEGQFVGYGLGYQAPKDIKIMVVPIGYANGYSRSLSNNGHLLVKETRAPVIGTVNMNMTICDITEIPNVKIGDEVVLVGRQGDSEISFASFAEMNNSLNYEILARLPENIERIMVD